MKVGDVKHTTCEIEKTCVHYEKTCVHFTEFSYICACVVAI